MELIELQSQLELKNKELIRLYEQQKDTMAELAQLRTHNANRHAKTNDSE